MAIMSQPTNWYTIQDIDQLDSPALVIFPQRVQENIRRAVDMIGDVTRLRPHIKTHKTKEASRQMLAAGIGKFKCATIAEAEMLGQCKAPDVLLAYQPGGPKLQRFAQLVEKYPGTSYSCLVDNIDAAGKVAGVFAAQGKTMPVFIDLNVGQNRTGIAPGKNAMELFRFCSATKGISFAGLHAYDGHIRNKDFEERKKACNEAFSQVEAMKKEIMQAGSRPVIIAGGSPTFSIHCKREEVECSPGTFVFWDKGYSDLCPEQPFEPAAVLVTRVISLPDATEICLDLGHKSVAAENEITRRVFFPAASFLKPVAQSEEHLVLEAGAGHSFKPGDVLYGIPFHICPTVALYERAITVENGKVSGEWRIVARDRKITV
jgi:D-serine deaminase-like pyridoxal phosphate-dependent protein